MKTLLSTIIFSASLVSLTAQDLWLQKPSFTNMTRFISTGFSIGDKGYFGTGVTGNTRLNDFWEYNPDNESWTQKANFPGGARLAAISFSVGDKGYLGLGEFDQTNKYSDMWEYDPATNSWVQKANYPGGVRSAPFYFVIGDTAYVGTGADATGLTLDFHAFVPATNNWIPKANFPGGVRANAIGFAIDQKGYAGTGSDGSNNHDDFWEYDPASDTWTSKASVPGGTRVAAKSFSIGSFGYVSTGLTSVFTNDLQQYDPSNNTWTAKANFPGTPRYVATAFHIGDRGYLGTGFNNVTAFGDFYEYIPSGIPQADFSVSDTMVCPGTTINFKDESTGYILNWNWTFTGGSPSTSQSENPSVTYSSPGMYEVSLTVSNADGSDTETKSGWITVLELPEIHFTGDTAICKGDTALIIADVSGNGPFTYSWFAFNLDPSLPDNHIAVAPEVSSRFLLMVTDVHDCEVMDSVHLTVHPLPQPVITQVGNVLEVNIAAESYQWYKNDTVLPGANSPTYEISASGEYRVIVVNEFGCHGESDVFHAVFTGMEIISLINSYHIYPNPASGHLTITFHALSPLPIVVKIFDLKGKLAESQLINATAGHSVHRLSTGHLPSGVYMLQLDLNGRESSTRTFVISR